MENVNFHPSIFTNTDGQLVKGDRTLTKLVEERATRLDQNNAPKDVIGGYHLTPKNIPKRSLNPIKNVVTESLLSQMFFSDKNMQSIQNILRLLMYKHASVVIDNQSPEELLIIMRSVYLEYSSHPEVIDQKSPMDRVQRVLPKYTNEVARLNEIVVNQIVPKVLSQLQQYMDYIRDATEQPYIMDRPTNDSVAGKKEYRSITGVLLGTEL
jgi:hypothetical protein